MFKTSNEKGHEAHTSCQLIIDPGAIVQVTDLANPVSCAHQMTPICEKSLITPWNKPHTLKIHLWTIDFLKLKHVLECHGVCSRGMLEFSP